MINRLRAIPGATQQETVGARGRGERQLVKCHDLAASLLILDIHQQHAQEKIRHDWCCLSP